MHAFPFRKKKSEKIDINTKIILKKVNTWVF